MHRFGALDGLRAVSAIAVVWHHTSSPIPAQGIAGKGFLGVDFFFAISGFLITTLLVRERNATARISLRKFYVRRVLRIFPLYYMTFLIYTALAVVTWRRIAENKQFLHDLPAFATYTSNWFVDFAHTGPFAFAWSLATEEQFYLLWPPLLVAALAVARGRVWVPLAVLTTLVTISQGAHLVAATSVPPGRIPASLSLPILLGAAAALVASTPRGFALLAFVLGRSWSAPATALLLAIALALISQRQVIQCLMAAVVVSVCLAEWTPLHPVLQWRPLAFVGVISYGVYMLHM
jgi:peptidoglycan/LPS O-acetylase OafA/YrhL